MLVMQNRESVLPIALADCGRSAGRSAIIAVLAALWFLLLRTNRSANVAASICVVLVGLDLWSAGSGWHRFAPAGFYGRTADHIEHYRGDSSQFRVMSIVNRRDRDPDPVGLSSNFGSLHEIQVLDDSTDETRDLVDETVRVLREQGIDIHVCRREDRSGYK
ncbi:MAG: hypothetical protein IIA12_00425, partial [Proteobacteria bacterium]|nr:hypothetical protein [Pseudomonadota bacterium]